MPKILPYGTVVQVKDSYVVGYVKGTTIIDGEEWYVIVSEGEEYHEPESELIVQ